MATPLPRRLLTLADWEALPEDNSTHYELQEGVLVASPRPARPHQKALAQLIVHIGATILSRTDLPRRKP
jgi:hypothetical protein